MLIGVFVHWKKLIKKKSSLTKLIYLAGNSILEETHGSFIHDKKGTKCNTLGFILLHTPKLLLKF